MEQTTKILKNLIPPKKDAEYAYNMGFDCAINGANTTNCHFTIFSSNENMKAWEAGKRAGEKMQKKRGRKRVNAMQNGRANRGKHAKKEGTMKHKPCPFCGMSNLVVSYNSQSDYWQVRCVNCGARGPNSLNKKEAWYQWDTQPEPKES